MSRKRISGITFASATLLSFICPVSSSAASPGDDSDYENAPGARYLPKVIRIDDETEADILEESGAKILFRRGDILLTLIPTAQNDLNNDDATDDNGGESRKSHHLRTPALKTGVHPWREFNTPALLNARSLAHAQEIIIGTGFAPPYTGKGVVVGFCDIGFDPMHISFTSPDGKESRISRIIQYKEREGTRIELSSPEEYAAWQTDTLDFNHATHVAGILAGGYRGNDYYGSAPDAEIIATTSQLSSVGLLAGVEEIISYAKEVGKTPVINLSMGNQTGPHDGTSLFSQYLDMCADDAIIVISAGNSGNSNVSMRHDFTAESPVLTGKLGNTKWTNFDMDGMVDIWSADSRGLTFTPVVYDDSTGEIVLRLDPVSPTGFEVIGYATDNSFGEGFAPLPPEFSQLMNGALLITGGVNPDNGRYNLQWLFETHTTEMQTAGRWARYVLGFEITAPEGSHVDVYSDGVSTLLKRAGNGVIPDSRQSISDLACGQRVVSVGMCNNRERMFYLDGTDKLTGRPIGYVNQNSSYGTIIDGRVLPLTVAPGADVISAASTPYLLAHGEGDETNSLVASENGKDWYWVENLGTSMSAPLVAGCIATWMEAYPGLKTEDVIDIIRESNSHSYKEPDDPRHGQGWFDAAAGLRKVLALSTICDITEEGISMPFQILRGEEGVHLINPAELTLEVNIFSPDGRKIRSIRSSEPDFLIESASLPKGIYIFTATGNGITLSESIAR